jgi:hypothetical protein
LFRTNFRERYSYVNSFGCLPLNKHLQPEKGGIHRHVLGFCKCSLFKSDVNKPYISLRVKVSATVNNCGLRIWSLSVFDFISTEHLTITTHSDHFNYTDQGLPRLLARYFALHSFCLFWTSSVWRLLSSTSSALLLAQSQSQSHSYCDV